MLLATRKIFLVENLSSTSTDDIVRKLDTFKGVEVLKNECNSSITSQLKTAISNNRSVLCFDRSSIYNFMKPIHITIVDSSESPINLIENVLFADKNIDLQFKELAEKLNVDTGDFKSDTSKEVSIKACDFCTLNIPNKILYQTKNFKVFVTLGCFEKGYLLIIPNDHVCSFGELNFTLLQEYEDLALKFSRILERLYGKKVLIWENGSGIDSSSKSKSSIVHAHMHLIPTDIDILDTLEKYQYPVEPVSMVDLHLFKEKKYLLIKPCQSIQYHIVSSENFYIPRQYIRQLLADHLGLPEGHWNWRQFEHWDLLNETYNELLNEGL